MPAYLQLLDFAEVEEFADDPGAYTKVVNIVEVVDQDGNPWEPAPGPDPWDDLAIAQATKISNGTYANPPEVYGFESLTVIPATFTGGLGEVTTQYRIQKQEAGTDSWSNATGWGATPPTVAVGDTPPGSKFRAQSKATDEAGDTKTSNSVTPTVGTTTTIGNITIDPASVGTTPDGATTFTVSWDGDVVGPMIIWSIRSGPGQIISPNNMSVEVEVQATGSAGETIQVQVDLSDPSSSDGPKGSIATLLIQ